MKTIFFSLITCLLCGSAFSQDQRTSFDGLSVITTPAGMAVQLSWSRGDEDVAFYVVERSNNGIDFKQCAIVFLSEDPEFTEYKFREKITAYSGGLVYRIGIVNEQKRIAYLPARKVISPATL